MSTSKTHARRPDDDPPPAFVAAFGSLVRRTTIAGGRLEAGTMQDYWTTLQDLPLEGLVAAADDLARRRVFFPAVAEWRQAATAIQPARIVTDCAQCGRMGLIKICYHSGDLFDIAICRCRVGQAYRLGGERLVRLRCGLQDTQQVALIEDVLAAQQDEALGK